MQTMSKIYLFMDMSKCWMVHEYVLLHPLLMLHEASCRVGAGSHCVVYYRCIGHSAQENMLSPLNGEPHAYTCVSVTQIHFKNAASPTCCA